MSIDQAGLREWVEELTGRPVTGLHRMPGGASRVSLRVDYADGPNSLLRIDTGKGPLSGTAFNLEREYRVLKALSDAAFSVPRTVGFSSVHNAILMDYIEACDTAQLRLTTAQAADQQRGLLAKIVELQRLEPAASGLLGQGWPSVGTALEEELDTWQQLYRERVAEPQPVLEFCWRWLRDNMPAGEQTATLVHGDLGPGNFLCDAEGSILVLIDWELVHIGHPLEDLACVLCRALGSPFGDPAQLVRWYTDLSGQPVDRAALSYAIVLVLVRWSVGINMALSHPSVEQDVPMLMTFRQSNQHALLGQLADHYRVPMPATTQVPAAPAPADVASAGIYDYLIASLEGPLQVATDDNFCRYRMRGLSQLASFLRDRDRYGCDRYEREERGRIGDLLGGSFTTLRAARRALAAAAASGRDCDDVELVQHLLWWVAREQGLLTAAMGAMAQRRIAW